MEDRVYACWLEGDEDVVVFVAVLPNVGEVDERIEAADAFELAFII